MSLIRNDGIYRESPDYVERLEGGEPVEVYQVLRLISPESDSPLKHMIKSLVMETVSVPDVDQELEHHLFITDNDPVIVMKAEHPSELAPAQKRVGKMLPAGWRAIPSRNVQMRQLKAANSADARAWTPKGDGQ